MAEKELYSCLMVHVELAYFCQLDFHSFWQPAYFLLLIIFINFEESFDLEFPFSWTARWFHSNWYPYPCSSFHQGKNLHKLKLRKIYCSNLNLHLRRYYCYCYHRGLSLQLIVYFERPKYSSVSIQVQFFKDLDPCTLHVS